MAAGAVRMALSKLGPYLKNFVGKTPMDNVIRYAPDVGYAAMAGTMFAPENATLGERGSMVAEDLGYGLLSSIGGQALGRGLGSRVAKNRKLVGDKAEGLVESFQTGGDMAGQMGMVMLPRPISQGVYEAAGERANQTQEQISANQQQLVEEQQLTAQLASLAELGLIGVGAATGRGHLGSGPMMTTGLGA